MHYRETSLFEHNDELDTTLRVPIGMVDLPSPSAGPTLIVEKVAVLTTVMVTVTVTRIQQFADRSRHSATGTHVPYGITHCHPAEVTFQPLPQPKLVLIYRPRGMQG